MQGIHYPFFNFFITLNINNLCGIIKSKGADYFSYRSLSLYGFFLMPKLRVGDCIIALRQIFTVFFKHCPKMF